ncbi:MAG: GGDEF domain-containing protein [Thermoleophilaceae bacterium]|nr:GGDEF domain-containing protein [Thermoleophilaceae bacterium]
MGTFLLGGVMALMLAVTWFVCGLRGVPIDPWYHAPLAGGWLMIVAASSLDPNQHSADVVYPMLPMLVALMIFPANRSWPYVIAGVAGSCGFVIFGQDPTPLPRSIIVGVLVVGAAAILLVGHSQLHAALKRNRSLSETDPLTGLPNSRRLMTRLHDEFARDARGEDGTFGVLALDLDAFKTVNDTLGHSTGDRVLVEVARAIERELEPSDMAVRRGGDEFTVVALEHEGRRLSSLRERIAEAISETRSQLCPSIEPRASVGLVMHEAGERPEDLLHRADDALHEAKQESHVRRGNPERQYGQVLAFVRADVPNGEDRELLGSEANETTLSYDEMVRTASWQMLAACYAMIAACVPLIGITGRGDSLSPVVISGVCLAAAAGAAACLVGGPRTNRKAPLHVAIIGAIVLAVALVSASGAVLNATADILIMPAMLAFYVVGRRAAHLYALTALGLYGYFLSTTSYDLTVIRTVQTAAVVLLVGAILPRTLKQTRAACDESERLSGIDALTGLANVRRMHQRLNEELARAATVGGQVTIFMIDLDDFKLVNDRYSHTVGDRMLEAVGAKIMGEMRAYDLAVRRGGDEFLIVMPHGGELDAAAFAERIAESIAEVRLKICPDLNPRASVGYATARPGDSAAELIACVDQKEKSVKLDHREDLLLAAG